MFQRRSPYGERGLKSIRGGDCRLFQWSLPVRGAWIEIPGLAGRHRSKPRRSPYGERGLKSIRGGDCRLFQWSLPVRGAWIEISKAVT